MLDLIEHMDADTAIESSGLHDPDILSSVVRLRDRELGLLLVPSDSFLELELRRQHHWPRINFLKCLFV